jgi:pilus assembly protein Flp/PilA
MAISRAVHAASCGGKSTGSAWSFNSRLSGRSLPPLSIHGMVKRGFFMQKLLARFMKDEAAATAIEYGLIAAGISIAIIAIVNGSWRPLS